MGDPQSPPPPPGWYADPEVAGGQRYWDGGQWTDQRRSPANEATETPPPPPTQGQVAAPTQGQVVYVERAGNGLAVAALVCGIVGLVLGLVPILFAVAWALGLVAVVLGIIARRRAVRRPEVGRKTMSTVSIVLGVLSIGIGCVGYAIVNDAFEDLEESSEELEQDLKESGRELERDLDAATGEGAIESSADGAGNQSSSAPARYEPYVPGEPRFYYLAELPAGNGWSQPVETQPTDGDLLRTTVRGPDGMLVVVDRTPEEPPRFGGDFDSSREVSHPRFGSATEYVFSESEAFDECNGSTCVDYLVEDSQNGGWGVLGAGPNLALAKEVAANVAQSITDADF